MNADNPYLLGAYAPVDEHVTAEGLEVIGELPADLDGVYVRNGPNARFEPRGRYHWFDGDGMVHAIRFQDGAASYRNRWVRTEGLAREEEAGEAQWTGLLESTRDNPKGAPYKDTANTDVVAFGGRLICLWYICGEPYAVDPVTLETLGRDDFGTGERFRLSAHAKVDAHTGELMFFDYGPRPPFLRYGVVSADGTLAHRTDVELPGPRLPHDMAITERHTVLMDLPVLFRPEALKLGRWLVDYHRDVPARFAVAPRDGSGAPRWFEAESCYIYHTVNAWDEGNEVVLVGCRCTDPMPEVDPADGPWGRAMANLRLRASLYEWRFDLETGETRERQLDDRSAEFPVIDADRTGRPTRYSYHMSIPEARTLVFDGIVKYDARDGSSVSHDFGPGCYGSEAVFAPRAGRRDDAAEDDGYVIAFVHDEREQQSSVHVLDARDVAAGPIARVLLPQRVPLGFHACWVHGEQLAGAS